MSGPSLREPPMAQGGHALFVHRGLIQHHCETNSLVVGGRHAFHAHGTRAGHRHRPLRPNPSSCCIVPYPSGGRCAEGA